MKTHVLQILTAALLVFAPARAIAGLKIIAGHGQAMPPSFSTMTDGREPLTVQLTDATGRAMPNVPSPWTLRSGGGGLSSAITTTDFRGVATVHFTAPPLLVGMVPVAQVLVNASAQSGDSVNFQIAAVRADDVSASAVAVRFATLARSLTLRAGEVLPGAIEAVVSTNTWRTGAVPVPGVAMRILNLSGDAAPDVQCRGIFALSDAYGVIRCDLAASSRTGDVLVAAAVGPVREIFRIRVEQGGPATVRILQGGDQAGVVVGQTLAPLTVEILDAAGNALPNTSVRWDGTGVSLVGQQTATDLNGRATATVRADRAGAVSVAVTAGGATARFNFQIANAPGSVAPVAGANQTAAAEQPFAQPISARVTDGTGQPISSVMVDFQVLSGSAKVQPASVQTDKSGIASAVVTAGSTAGPVLVKASASGMAATFNLSVREAAPALAATDILNAAGLEPGVSPGSLATVRVRGIASALRGAVTANPVIGPLPTRLADVEVEFNGVAAPVLAVTNASGEESVLVQVPWEVVPGPAVVKVKAGTLLASAEDVPVWPVKPGVFTTAGAGAPALAVATRPDGSYVSAANAARRGEEVRIYASGLGQTLPAAGTGKAGIQAQVVTAPLIAGLNNAGVRVKSAQAMEGAVGVFVVTIVVPADTPGDGNQLLGLGVAAPDGSMVFANTSLLPVL